MGRSRCAIYTRVSTTDQNCDRQRRDLVGFADAAGYETIAIHSETASGAKNDRVERAKILQLARSRKIDAVLVTEISRWGRSMVDLVMSLEELASYGVSVICQTGMQYDLSTPHGKLIAQIMSSMAEFERSLLAERVKSGVACARSKGKILGRPIVDTSSRCDKVNNLRSQGLSDRAIARELKLGRGTIGRCARLDVPEGMNW
jgi:putative DNA-invertase from lambdoid prophage Rac